jgi:hypothetical protein
MLKSFEGIWWLPDKPEEQIEGTLRFDPSEGARLELKEILNIEEAPIILGFSDSPIPHIEFTLLNCDNQAKDLLGVVPPKFYVKYVFMGTHFQKPEDIKFRDVSVQLQYLFEWAGITGLNIEHPSEKEVLIRYEAPEAIKEEINNELNILIGLDRYIMPSQNSQKEICIKEEAEIKIEPSEEKPFEYYLDIIDKIQKFLALATTKPVIPIEIRGTTELHKTEIIGIYYKIPNIPSLPEKILPNETLFTLKDIPSPDRLGKLLKNWIERTKTKELKPLYELYFGVLYSPSIYLEHRFLSFVIAIEGYHRRKFNREYLSEEEYKSVYDKLVEVIPKETNEDLKNRLIGSLEYGNEFSLRSILNELLGKYQVILDEMTEDELKRLKIKKKEKFINTVVDVRNYLVHQNKELEKKFSGGAFRLLICLVTQKLDLLIQAILLEEIGFEPPKVEELLKRKIQKDRNRTVIIGT